MHARWRIGLAALAIVIASGARAAQVENGGRGGGQGAPAKTQADCAGSATQPSSGVAGRSSKALEGASDALGAVPDTIDKGATSVGSAIGLEGTSNKAFGKAAGMVIGIGGKAALASKGLGMLGNKLAPDQAAAEDGAPVAAGCVGQSGSASR